MNHLFYIHRLLRLCSPYQNNGALYLVITGLMATAFLITNPSIQTVFIITLSIIGLWFWNKTHQELRATQESLKDNKQRFELAMRGANAGLWEYNFHTEEMVWSPHLYRMLGFTNPKQGNTWNDFLKRIHPNDFDWVTTLLKQHWNFKATFDVEFRIRHQNGNYIWVHGFAITEWDKEDTPVKMAGSLINIHQRKTTEKQFDQIHQHNRNILQALDQSAIVAITDPNGIITHVNEQFCHTSGYTRNELIGKTHNIINSGVHDKEFIQNLWETIQSGNVWEGDICNRAKNGEFYWVKTVIVPYRDETGQPYQFVSLRQDITNHKIAEQELLHTKDKAEQASQLKSQFLKIISHELRTPLNAITGVNQLLADTPLNDEQKQLCRTLFHSSQALYNLVSDILDFEHLSQNHLELEHAPFNLSQLLNQVIQQNKTTDSNQNQLELQVDNQLPSTLFGDAKRIRQVLTQLLRNASTHTHEGRVILNVSSEWIDTSQNNCTLTFSIQDTGCGIPENKINELFDPFTQLELFTTRKTQGLGLGLAICQKIIHNMGGNITVKSVVNQGSTFQFTLCLPFEHQVPTIQAHQTKDLAFMLSQLNELQSFETKQNEPASSAPNSQPISPQKAESASNNNFQILLVEDNEINQMVTCRLLEKLGYTSEVANNGLEALEKLRNNTYELILMDVQMPEMDGLETTQRIRRNERENPQLQSTSIVALTANVMSGDKEECLEAGMNDYLSKPIEKGQLANMLQKYRVYPANTPVSHITDN